MNRRVIFKDSYGETELHADRLFVRRVNAPEVGSQTGANEEIFLSRVEAERLIVALVRALVNETL